MTIRRRPSSTANCRRPASEGADEHHLLGILADVDEAAGARETWAKFADVQIALLVRLGKTEEGGIKAAAIVVVELIGLIDDGLRD